MEIEPTSAEIRLEYADTLVAAGDDTKAIEQYKKYLEINPQNPDVYFQGRAISSKFMKQVPETLEKISK